MKTECHLAQNGWDVSIRIPGRRVCVKIDKLIKFVVWPIHLFISSSSSSSNWRKAGNSISMNHWIRRCLFLFDFCPVESGGGHPNRPPTNQLELISSWWRFSAGVRHVPEGAPRRCYQTATRGQWIHSIQREKINKKKKKKKMKMHQRRHLMFLSSSCWAFLVWSIIIALANGHNH